MKVILTEILMFPVAVRKRTVIYAVHSCDNKFLGFGIYMYIFYSGSVDPCVICKSLVSGYYTMPNRGKVIINVLAYRFGDIYKIVKNRL